MANTYNGILFSLKKEENLVTCYNIDEPWENHTKKSKAWDFPGGPVLRLSLPVQGLGIQYPTCLMAKKPKHKTSNIVTNSIKTLKKRQS